MHCSIGCIFEDRTAVLNRYYKFVSFVAASFVRYKKRIPVLLYQEKNILKFNGTNKLIRVVTVSPDNGIFDDKSPV